MDWDKSCVQGKVSDTDICDTDIETMQCPELMGEAVLSFFSTVTQTSAIHINHQGNIKKHSVILPSFALKRSFQ